MRCASAIHPGDYLIHGTNNPQAVGMAVTHGCIRMYPEDIEALFKIVPVGTKVWLINEPVKVAYVDGELLLEAHPQIDAEGQPMEPDLDMLSLRLDHALGSTTAAINWDLARETLQAAQGMPTLVGLQADPDAPPAEPPGWAGGIRRAPAAAHQSSGAAAVPPVPPGERPATSACRPRRRAIPAPPPQPSAAARRGRPPVPANPCG